MATATLDWNVPKLTARVASLVNNPNTTEELTDLVLPDGSTQEVETSFLASLVFDYLHRVWVSIFYRNLLHQQWVGSFDQFVDDVTKEIGYRDNVDQEFARIDTSLPYCPGNIKWASRSEHIRLNRRMASYIEIRGVDLPVVAWMEFAGIKRTQSNRSLISRRIRRGMLPSQVFHPDVVSRGRGSTTIVRSLGTSKEFLAWVMGLGEMPKNIDPDSIVPLEDGLAPLTQVEH